jgi:hypothetical protein
VQHIHVEVSLLSDLARRKSREGIGASLAHLVRRSGHFQHDSDKLFLRPVFN